MNRIFIILLAVIAIAIPMHQLSAKDVKATDNVVNIYSSRHYDVDQQLYKLFEQKTGIKVQHTESGATEILEKLKQEGSRSPADLLISVDIGNIWRANTAGIFEPVSSDVLTKSIPAELRDPGNQWFGISKRARVIFYNKAKVKPDEITSYEDLADPKWKGRILVRPSSNVYNQSLVASIIAADGIEAAEKWAKGLITNLAKAPSGNDVELIRDVANGEADVTFANTYYFARMMQSDKPAMREAASKVGWVFPNQNGRGAHINISGMGLIKNARHKDNAIKFMEFLVSPEAQEIFAASNNEYPVISGVAENSTVKSLGTFKSDSVHLADIGKNSVEAIKLMDRAGWK